MKNKPRFQDFGQASRAILGAKALPQILVTMEQEAFLGFFFLDQLRKKTIRTHQWQEVEWNQIENTPEVFGQGDLFSQKKILVVGGLDHAAKFSKAIKAIFGLLQNSEDCVIIRKKNVPGGQGFWKEASQFQFKTVACIPPYDNEVPAAVKLFSDLLKVPLAPDAVNLLQTSLGSDLRLLYNEINKLALVFPNSPRPLTSNEVECHIDVLKQDHIFKINDLLLTRQNGKAAILANDLINRGESPIALVGLVARHIRNALQVKQLRRSGTPPKQIASELRLPMRVVTRYTEYSNQTTKAQLGRALAHCHEADICLKSSRRDPYLVLDQIVSSLQ